MRQSYVHTIGYFFYITIWSIVNCIFSVFNGRKKNSVNGFLLPDTHVYNIYIYYEGIYGCVYTCKLTISLEFGVIQ